MADSLPPVPTLDGAPTKKPSGAWFRKAKLARERGLEPPPRPFGFWGAGPARPASSEGPPKASAAAREPEPAGVTIPPASAQDVAPALTTADVEAATKETERAEDRRALLTLGRDQLERRVGSLGALGFRITGILLGDEEAWALTETQREELAVLFVEAFPDECAQLVQDGNAAKLLALGTLGQIVRSKWVVYRAKKANGGAAPVTVVEAPKRAAPGAPPAFRGLPDMQGAGA